SPRRNSFGSGNTAASPLPQIRSAPPDISQGPPAWPLPFRRDWYLRRICENSLSNAHAHRAGRIFGSATAQSHLSANVDTDLADSKAERRANPTSVHRTTAPRVRTVGKL